MRWDTNSRPPKTHHQRVLATALGPTSTPRVNVSLRDFQCKLHFNILRILDIPLFVNTIISCWNSFIFAAITCPPLDPGEFGSLSFHTMRARFNTSITVTCETGFSHQPLTNVRVKTFTCLHTGEWSPTVSKCVGE